MSRIYQIALHFPPNRWQFNR